DADFPTGIAVVPEGPPALNKAKPVLPSIPFNSDRMHETPPKEEDRQMNQRSYCLAALTVLAVCIAYSSSPSRANDEAEINASVQRLVAAVNAKDINGIMAYYSPSESLLVFDALPPRQYVGA